MMAATYSADSTFNVENQRRLFDARAFNTHTGGRGYDLAHSGDRFLMILESPPKAGRGGETAYGMFQILNWFTEVEARERR
jgi:hypothetical protein